MSLKEAILEILNVEESLDIKLSLLTEIGLTSTNEETFKVTEEIRNELVELEGILG